MKKNGTTKKTGTRAAREPQMDLLEVTAALQVLMRQTRERADEAKDLPELADVMEKFSRACTRLITLLKTLQVMADEKESRHPLLAALDETLEDLGRKAE